MKKLIKKILDRTFPKMKYSFMKPNEMVINSLTDKVMEVINKRKENIFITKNKYPMVLKVSRCELTNFRLFIRSYHYKCYGGLPPEQDWTIDDMNYWGVRLLVEKVRLKNDK